MSRTTVATASQTERLCQFVVDTEYEDVPENVLDHAKEMIVDSVAATLAARDSDPGSVVAGVYQGAYDGGEARIPGTNESGTVRDVAFLTGVRSHALDFDDVHHRMGGHPSTPVLSALLPIAEREGVSGADLLRSFVLGVEAEVLLADVLNPGHYERGWHPTAIFGTIGAAAAVGDLLGLDLPELRNAAGIAASQAAGMKGNFGTMTKSLHVGNAARSGQEAAELAAGRFTANDEILELEFGGFCDLFQGDPPYDFDSHLDGLGSPWAILDPPVGFKPYPCCGSTHSAIDAALDLRERCDLSPDTIESVRIEEHPRRLGHTNKPEPTTALDGKFSVQYCVTAALFDGTVWIDHFDDETVRSEAYQSFLSCVEIVPDRELFSDRESPSRSRTASAPLSLMHRRDRPSVR
jgi:2-methylcitrate dehydratase PrpD